MTIIDHRLLEHACPRGYVLVTAGTTVDDLLRIGFFDACAGYLSKRSTIEVHWDDSSRLAELYVHNVATGWIVVSLLSYRVFWSRLDPRSAPPDRGDVA